MKLINDNEALLILFFFFLVVSIIFRNFLKKSKEVRGFSQIKIFSKIVNLEFYLNFISNFIIPLDFLGIKITTLVYIKNHVIIFNIIFSIEN